MIEDVVVVIAIDRSQQGQVLVADDDSPASCQSLCHLQIGRELMGILQCLVIAAESAHHHSADSPIRIDIDVEVAHQIAGEVVFRNIVEQLVLIHAVRRVGKHERIVGVKLRTERVDGSGIAWMFQVLSLSPDVVGCHPAALQSSALLHALYYLSCHITHLALGIILYYLAHSGHTAVGLLVVEVTQSLDKQELRAVLTCWESLCR